MTNEVLEDRLQMNRTARDVVEREREAILAEVLEELDASEEENASLRERVADLTTELASVRGERDSARVSLAWEHSRLGGGR